MNSGNLTQEKRLSLHFWIKGKLVSAIFCLSVFGIPIMDGKVVYLSYKPGGDKILKPKSLVSPRTVSMVNILTSCMSNFLLVDFPTLLHLTTMHSVVIVVSTCAYILLSNSQWMGILMESHN